MQFITILQSALPQIKTILASVCYIFFALALLAGIIRLLLIGHSTAQLKQHVRSLRSVDYRRFQDSEHVMPVSLILPATKETGSLKEQLENLLSLDFKQYELIVVANSEHAEAWASLDRAYMLLPFHQPYKKTLKSAPIEGIYRSAKDVRLVVIDCKADNTASALNAGVNVSSYPIIAPVYPDLRLTKDALLKMVYAFVSDSACVYIGSFSRAKDSADDPARKQTMISQQQYLERLTLFYTNRAGYADLGVYLPLSRTFAAFLKSAVLESGGFSDAARAPGADLLLRIHARMRREKRAYCARLLPDAVCYQMPKQRMRDVCAAIRTEQREMRDTVRRNRVVAQEITGVVDTRFAEKIWPFVELLGVITVILSGVLGVVSPVIVVLYLLLGILFGSAQSVSAALLEEYAFQRQTDTGLLLRRYLLAIFDNIGFRLLTSLVRVFS
jgi:hypothetical protein